MSFSFSPDLSDAVSRIRLDLGDTAAPGLLEDETITAMLAASSNEREATIKLASALIVRFAQEPDKVELAGDEGAVSWGNKVKGWQALISRLQAETLSAKRESGGFSVLRPSRYGEERAEYRGDGRCPW
jgi:hypothetical protein